MADDQGRKRPRSNHVVAEESVHFFKIILTNTIREKKLKIPSKFAGEFGHQLISNVATLIVPDGRKWEIGLTKANGVIWFDEGWDEFVENYSICDGHLLAFRYDRNSTFHVIIFDQTATEIDYPIHVSSDDEELNNGDDDEFNDGDDDDEEYLINQESESEDDDSVGVLGAETLNKNSGQHAELNRLKRPKIEEVINIEDDESNLDESREINSNKKEPCSSKRNLCTEKEKKNHLMNQNAETLHDLNISAQLEDLKSC